MAEYSVVKTADGKYWNILKDGNVYSDSPKGCYQYPSVFKRKCEASAEIATLQAHDEYIARLMAEDKTGIYHWTESDEKQINDYADILKANELRWTFTGQFTAQEIGRQQHRTNAEDLARGREYWIDPDRVYAETRRVMAARVEAFKRAGLELEEATQ